jgi:ATP-binding cassette subfamily C protein
MLKFERTFASVGLSLKPGIILCVVIGAFLLQYSVFLLQARLAADLQSRYQAAWQSLLFRSFLHARWRFFVDRKAGELSNSIIGETNRLSGAFYLSVQLMAMAIFTSVYVGLAIAMSWQISLALLLIGGLLIIAFRPLLRHASRIGVKISRRNDDLHFLVGEFIGGAKLVKASATEEQASARFDNVVEQLRRLNFRSSFDPSLVRAIFEFTGATVLAVTLVVGIQTLLINPATVAIVLVIFVRLFPRLSGFQQNWQTLNIYAPAIESISELLTRATEEREMLDDSPLPPPFYGQPIGLEVEHLSVHYGELPALQDLSLSIPGGSTVALVGSSGAGKSTLVDCILQLVRPSAGKIKIGGFQILDLPIASWRRAVGYVSQDTFLFNASVHENICWGDESANDSEIVNAARRAFAHDFILALPDGYDTVIGDRGVRLSGGQRQRIGLARTLLNHIPLLILDEATSALDSESEAMVLDAIKGLHGQLTIIIVAHRLSTVKNADLIFVLEKGRLVESGTWQSLLESEGRFSQLWKIQSEQGKPAWGKGTP